MTKHWIAVSAFLMLIAGLLGWQLQVTSKRFDAENDLSKMKPATDVRQRMNSEGSIPSLQPPRLYNAAEFAVVPNQNVFSETRAREEKTEVQQPPPPPELATKPVLVGVTISGSQRQALIIDPTIPAGSRPMVTKRPGDLYQGYVITDITESQMVLENGPRREIIPLFDGTKHTAQAGKTPILATRVVSFGGGASGAAQPVVISASSGAARPSGQAPVPIGTPRTAVQPSQQTQQTQVAQPQQNRPANQGVDAQGRQVIHTPFGDMPVATPPKPPNNQ